ncbi:MAG TPA: hypothetical protein VF777_11530 [Phycisphaerales bacterium]
MALTREQRIYLSVLAVAAAALTADRLFFGVTNPAVAAAADVIEQATSKSIEPVNQEPASARFAARLRAAAGTSDAPVEDLFAVRLVNEEVPAEAVSQPEVDSSRASADSFRLAHRVTAVATGKGAYAVINGRTVRTGESVAGLTLVEVTRESAVFEGEGVRVELSVVADR